MPPRFFLLLLLAGAADELAVVVLTAGCRSCALVFRAGRQAACNSATASKAKTVPTLARTRKLQSLKSAGSVTAGACRRATLAQNEEPGRHSLIVLTTLRGIAAGRALSAAVVPFFTGAQLSPPRGDHEPWPSLSRALGVGFALGTRTRRGVYV